MRKMGQTFRTTLGIAAVLALIPAAGHAVGEREGRGHGPPKEAIDACAGKSAGETVSFSTPCGYEVSGTCREVSGALTAVPEGWPRGEGRMGTRDGTRFLAKKAGREHRMGQGSGRGFARLAEALDLTEAQREQAGAILASERERTEPLRRRLAETRAKLREAMAAEPFDEEAVRTLAASREQARVELTVARGRARSRIHALLTPEQQERAKELRSRGKGRHMRGPWM